MTHTFSSRRTSGLRRLLRTVSVLGGICLASFTLSTACSPANQGDNAPRIKGQFATTGAVVHVNQVGYLPGADKIATVVNSSTSGLSFSVVDTSTGSSVFSGTTSVVGVDPASDQDVHHADFSSVSAAGTYVVRVGTDESHPFEVGLDVFDDDVKGSKLYKQALKYFYFHRMGVALHQDHLTDFADPGHERIAVHPYDDDVTGLNDWTQRNGSNSHLFDIKHAHGDAGDYGTYLEADAAAHWFLMNLFERYSSSFTDGDLDIPESGNGIPDLLDEIIYGSIGTTGMLPHADLDWTTISGELGSNDDKAYLAAHKCHNSTWWGYVKAEEWWYEPGNLAGHFTPLSERDCNHPYMTSALATSTDYCSDEKARPRYCMESSTGATFNMARKLAHLARLVAPYEADLQDPATYPTAKLTAEFTDSLHGAPSATDMTKMTSGNLWTLAKKAYKRASEINNGVWVNSMPPDEDTLPSSSHNTTFGGGPYNDGSQSDDQYAAAAEMFMTAAQLEPSSAGTYRSDVIGSSHYKEMKRFDWEKDGPMATLSLLTAASFGSDTSVELPSSDKTAMENKVLAYADFIKEVATDPSSTYGERQGYPSSVPTHANSTYGWPDADGEDNAESDVFSDQPEYVWGSNKHVVHGIIVLGYAYEISGNKDYIKAAHRMMDYLMGQNPLGKSYITGWGEDAWKTTHDRWALNRFGQAGLDYPKGWLVGGPMTLENLCGSEEQGTPRTGAKATRMASNDIAGAEDGWCSIENTMDWNAPLAFASFLVAEKHKSALSGSCSVDADCNDGNGCTTDTCSSGACSFAELGSSTSCSDDGSTCTDDVCNAGVCTHPDNGTCQCSSDADCDDGDPCTDNTCDANNTCQTSNNAANCMDDGDSCTNDVCSAGVCTHPDNGTCGGGSSATGDIKVLYQEASLDSGDNTIKPYLKIQNTSSSSVSLADLEVRYYFTAEAFDTVNNPVIEHCDYAAVDCANVTVDHESMGAAVTNADTYVSVKFSSGAGSVPAGSDSGKIQVRFTMKKWNNLDETNDYSFDSTASSYVETGDITLYQNGVLIWGTEPGSGTSGGDCSDPADTGPCADDGDSCTDDVCSNGVCTHTDNGSCTPQCTTNADCNDGNACTDDICGANGTCSNPTMNCDDGISCTVDSCSAGSCVVDSSSCDCSSDSDCGDNNECTTDTCTSSYQCSNGNVSDGSACSDGQSCTTESCQSGTCTVTDSSACGCSVDSDCNDNDACTDDVCNADGSCSNTAMVCDDGVSCTVDSCSAGSCVVDSSSCDCSSNADCNDGNQCTNNTCDSNYTCQTANYDSTVSCSTDSLSCTAESCDGNGSCGNFDDAACECSVDADCDDGNECTVDSCGADRMCDNTHEANGTMCTDDGDSCTDDICSSGSCTHPDNGTCSSSDPCANPTAITGSGSYNVDSTGTCFSFAGGVNGVMPSVMNTNNNSSAATTIEWHGGTDQNVTSCSNETYNLNGNGSQLNNFAVDEDASGVAYFTIKSQNSSTYEVQVSVQNWQNGNGCN